MWLSFFFSLLSDERNKACKVIFRLIYRLLCPSKVSECSREKGNMKFPVLDGTEKMWIPVAVKKTQAGFTRKSHNSTLKNRNQLQSSSLMGDLLHLGNSRFSQKNTPCNQHFKELWTIWCSISIYLMPS